MTTDANGRALPGFVTVSPELPPAQAAPADILTTTAAGWSLQTYRPGVSDVTGVDGITPGFAPTVQVVYLVSPSGQRYQLLELDPALPIVITSWTAGETVAYVRQCDPLECDPAAPTQLLDLLTGELSPAAGIEEGKHVGATLPGSVRWWQDGVDSAQLDRDGRLSRFAQGWVAHSASPDGKFLAVTRTGDYNAAASAGVAIVDATTGTITDIARLWTEPLHCEPFRWRADGALDVSCWDSSRAKWRTFTVGPAASEMKENKALSTTPPAEGPWVEPDFLVADGVWAGPYTKDSTERAAAVSTQIGLARNAGFEPLTVPDATVGSATVVAVIDGSVYVQAGQSRNPSLTTAWRYDVDAARWTELGTLPPAGPTRGLFASQGTPASGLTSWAIAP